MKTTFLLGTFLICCFGAFAQEDYKIIYVTPTSIVGYGIARTPINVDINLDGTADVNGVANSDTNFTIAFPAALVVGSFVHVWSTDNKKLFAYKVETTDAVLMRIGSIPAVLSANMNSSEVPVIDISRRNMTSIYKGSIWNTVFTIPVARINAIRDDNNTDASLSLFSSFGAGFGRSWGRYRVTRNDRGKIIKEEFSNSIGIYFGLLYSSETGENQRNIVSPVVNLNLLDFQLGAGYEAGTVADNQKRIFFTVSYSIPLYKLIDTNFRVWKRENLPVDEFHN